MPSQDYPLTLALAACVGVARRLLPNVTAMPPRTSTRFLAAALLLLPGLAFAETPPVDSDPVERLLREAALHSPRMLEQELGIAQADAFRFRGWRQYMPYINANYQAGYFNMLNAADPNSTEEGKGKFGGSYGISAYHPVYHWGAIEAEKKFAFAKENLARSEARVAWRALVMDIRAKFLEATVNKTRITLLEKRTEWARERLEAGEQELKLGRIVDADVTARRLELRNNELELARRKIELATQLARLRAQTGASELGVSELPEDLPDIRWDDAELASRFGDFQKNGAEDEPENRSAKYADEMYANQMIMAESREKPQFNLGASLNQTPVERNGGFGMQTYLFVGLMGSWNIFDRDTTRESVRALGVARRLVEVRLDSGRLQRTTELANALAQLRATREAIAIRRDIVKLRREAFEGAQQRRKLGLAKNDDVHAAEDAYLEARLSLLSDRSAVQNAYHAFMSGIMLSPTDSYYIAPTNDR